MLLKDSFQILPQRCCLETNHLADPFWWWFPYMSPFGYDCWGSTYINLQHGKYTDTMTSRLSEIPDAHGRGDHPLIPPGSWLTMACFVYHEPDLLFFWKQSPRDLILPLLRRHHSDSDVSSGLLFQFSIALSGSEHDLDPAHVLPAVAPRGHLEVQRVQGHQRTDFLCPLLARL